MHYVYFLKSLKHAQKSYVGYTIDLEDRLAKHNSGGSVYTAEHRPWKLITYVCFESADKAIAFENYMKSGSGYAFAKKRLW